MWISNLKLTFSIEGLKVICVDRWDCWNPAKILHSFEYYQNIGSHSKLPLLCNIGKNGGFLIMFKILCKFWKGKCARGRNYKSCLSCECLLLRSLHPFEGKERGGRAINKVSKNIFQRCWSPDQSNPTIHQRKLFSYLVRNPVAWGCPSIRNAPGSDAIYY